MKFIGSDLVLAYVSLRAYEKLLAHLKKKLFRKSDKTQGSDAALWINSGDFFQGTLWYTKFKWRMITKVRRNFLELSFSFISR